MTKAIRSPSHLKFIRTLCCMSCGGTDTIQAAHIRTAANSGVGMKPADRHVIPLCFRCHKLQHDIGQKAFFGDVPSVLKLADRLYSATGDWKEGMKIIRTYRPENVGA